MFNVSVEHALRIKVHAKNKLCVDTAVAQVVLQVHQHLPPWPRE